jgi:hypothetical protein
VGPAASQTSSEKRKIVYFWRKSNQYLLGRRARSLFTLPRDNILPKSLFTDHGQTTAAVGKSLLNKSRTYLSIRIPLFFAFV